MISKLELLYCTSMSFLRTRWSAFRASLGPGWAIHKFVSFVFFDLSSAYLFL